MNIIIIIIISITIAFIMTKLHCYIRSYFEHMMIIWWYYEQDPNYIATVADGATEVLILDVRVPCIPVVRFIIVIIIIIITIIMMSMVIMMIMRMIRIQWLWSDWIRSVQQQSMVWPGLLIPQSTLPLLEKIIRYLIIIMIIILMINMIIAMLIIRIVKIGSSSSSS